MSIFTKKRVLMSEVDSFSMRFDGSTIKHLGLQMYSSLPPVVGELVSNAWDAGANNVWIEIPVDQINSQSEIKIMDDGLGMSAIDIQNKYLVVGRDRRREENDASIIVSSKERKIMGRKGIGKFSGFGIARVIEVESVRDTIVSRFEMSYAGLEVRSSDGNIVLPKLPGKYNRSRGTIVILRNIQKFHNRKIGIPDLRRKLSRQFSIIGAEHNFHVFINGEEITSSDRDLKKLLDTDASGNRIIREYENFDIGCGYTISGWIGAYKRRPNEEDIIRSGVVILARGKMV
jgi:hypothetical protein